MGDPLSLVILLVVILAIVTLVGHGLWVLLAKSFGGDKAPPATERCPKCGAWLPPGIGGCGKCGWAMSRAVDRRRQDVLQSLFQQIIALDRRGLLDEPTKRRLVEAILAAQGDPVESQAAARSIAQAAGEHVSAPPWEAGAASAVPIAELVEEAQTTERRDDSRQELPVVAKAISTPPPADVGDRVRRYMQRQSQAPREPADSPTAAVSRVRTPRRPWSEVLAAFLEQSNIRWGELIGGLLIVCCSIALVISFWSEIAERPILKFIVFNGVTAALFGLGFYSHRQWRLETTSQGLLIIASLLVPLNFLAIAALSARGGGEATALTIAGEVVSIIVFTFFIYLAGRVVLSVAAWPLAVVVVLPSMITLLVGRYVNAETAAYRLQLFAAAPLVAYIAGNGFLLAKYRVAGTLRELEAGHLFKLLGLSTFAVLLPLGLLLAHSGRPFVLIHELAPLAALLSFPALAAGVLLWRQLDPHEGPWLRIAGTAVGVLGACILVAANVLAWPEPLRMLPVTAMTAAIFLLIAIAFRMREAHWLVAPAIGWTVLILVLVVVESISWRASAEEVIAALLSHATAITLVPLSFAFGLAGAFLLRRNRWTEGWSYALTAAATAVASLMLVSWLGLGVEDDPSGAVWIYVTYAAACLAVAWFVNHSAVAWLGAALLLVATIQGFVFTYASALDLPYPWLTALAAHSLICGLLAVVGRALSAAGTRLGFRWPMQWAASMTSLAAAALVVYLTPYVSPLVPAVIWSIVAFVWLVVGVAAPWLSVFSSAQLALVLAVIFGVASVLERFAWFAEARYPWLDPWTLASQGIALVGVALVWLLLRWALCGRIQLVDSPPEGDNVSARGEQRVSERLAHVAWLADLRRLLASGRPPLDHVLIIGHVVLLVALAVYAAAPGTMQELSPRSNAVAAASIETITTTTAGEANDPAATTQPPRVVPAIESFAIPDVPHYHAASLLSWALLASVVGLLLVSLRLEYEAWKGIALLIALVATPLLLATYAESQVAVASALRWLSTGYLLIGSAAIWCRRPLMQALYTAGLAPDLNQTRGAHGPLRNGVLVVSLVPLVAMLCYVGLTAVLRSPLPQGIGVLYGTVGLIAAMLSGVALFFRYPGLSSVRAAWGRQASTLSLTMGIGLLIAVTLYVVAAAMRQSPVLGPEPDSLFARMGTVVSYAVPVLVTAIVLVGYALRERDATFAFAGAVVLCIAATAGYLLWSAKQALPLDAAQWVRLAQLNSAVCAFYGLAWIALRRWDRLRRHITVPAAEPLLVTLIGLGVTLQVVVLVPAAVGLFVDPFPSLLLTTVGSAAGWASLAASLLAFGVLRASQATERVDLRGLSLLVLIAGIMLAASASQWDAGDWLCFHILLVSLAASAWSELAAGWREQRAFVPKRDYVSHAWPTMYVASFLAALTVVAAVRTVFGDPQAPWWGAGACLAMSALNAALAYRSLRRSYIAAAGLLVNIAATLVWLEYRGPTDWLPGVYINLIALALPAPLWMMLDSYQRSALRDRQLPGLPWYLASAWFALGLYILLVARGLAADVQAMPVPTDPWLAWCAWAAIGVAVVTCLWDARANGRIFALYLYGLTGAALVVDVFDLSPRWLAWTGLMVLAAFSVATSYLWSIRHKLAQLAPKLRIPLVSTAGGELQWLIPANAAIAAAVVALAFWVQLTFAEAELRVAASQAALAQSISLGLLAWGRARSPLQYASLFVGAIAAVAFGWSWLDPSTSGTLLNRAVVTLAAISAVAALYGLALSKLIRRTNEWTAAAERLVPLLSVAAAAVLALVLGVEAFEYATTEAVAMDWAAIVTVAIVLIGLCAAALVAALVPGRDPLGLSERGRTAYVYAAEVILALLFLHLRLTMPWLFGGFFRRYWPLAIILIAFVGVGLAELFRRQRRAVLAEPLERSGAFLPLLPILGFWFVPSEAHFTVIMVAAAGIYALLSFTRRSFVYGILAGAAANGGLWYLLAHADGWSLWEHPQVWFIPPALCVLAAAYLNRSRLGDTELTAIRYTSAVMIYVSSTADIFLVGVAEAPWLPFVLAGLSLAGIFAGILLRVRSFLLLGTGFLSLALLTVIWYAAVDLHQTWVWSVSGIVAGVVIIALFAVFEKKRQEVLGLIGQLKDWHR